MCRGAVLVVQGCRCRGARRVQMCRGRYGSAEVLKRCRGGLVQMRGR